METPNSIPALTRSVIWFFGTAAYISLRCYKIKLNFILRSRGSKGGHESHLREFYRPVGAGSVTHGAIGLITVDMSSSLPYTEDRSL